jgi:hypothetical protein
MDAPDARPRRAVLSRDTSAEAEQLQVEIWRRMSHIERAQVITGACRAARAFAFAGLRARHPDASERMLVALYAELTAGPELARRAYPELLGSAAPDESYLRSVAAECGLTDVLGRARREVADDGRPT